MQLSQTNTPISINIDNKQPNVTVLLTEVPASKGIALYDIEVRMDDPIFPKPITLKWNLKGLNVKGVWKPTSDFAKRIQADWELIEMESRISIDAPVITLFGHDDNNILTVACADAIHTLSMNTCIREEDNHYYCHLTFFAEHERPIDHYKTQLRIDTRSLHFSECLYGVSQWWENMPELTPISVPSIAKQPIYSTWYQFHQNLEEKSLLLECSKAYDLGYKAIIIDDGWQTLDENRGYDYTGDWQPDRFPDMANLIKSIHDIGMKAALWYSVPFCGKKSKAYQRFKGKFLTENHRWAPVFDPRYPEIRTYLKDIYTNALKNWHLDGLKLDFIDDFHHYPDTPTGAKNGRDYAAVNEAVDCLLSDIIVALKAINPDVFIEFRQKYTGPAMRKYGNMFRAFDCPGDAVMNRIRIADIRMLCGNTAVHADMITWHKTETVEVAALQLINVLFGVPQLSVLLQDATEDHLKMIAFYTKYWNENAQVLLQGHFTPSSPLANYPTQRVSTQEHTIVGVYENMVTTLTKADKTIHIHNGQISNEIIIKNTENFGNYTCVVYSCMGTIVSKENRTFSEGLHEITIPPCGILIATKCS